MNSVRRAEARDISAILNLLVQVDMVHHNGRPDLFRGPATKYTADELKAILADEARPVFVCVDEEDRVLGHGFCVMQETVTLNVWSCNPGAMAFYEKLGLVPYKVGMEKIL